MRRERRYEVHFSSDAFASIAEAILGNGEIEKFTFSIDRGNDGWGFDEEKQFLVAYSKGMDCARYFKSTSDSSVYFNVRSYETQVAIESKNERAIESCLAMLDGFASALEKIVPPYSRREKHEQQKTQQPPESGQAESKAKNLRVSSEAKFTSCIIRPQTIAEAQDLIVVSVVGGAELISDSDFSMRISLEGSEGTVQYNDAKDVPAQYFEDDITSISIISNNYRGEYATIDIRLSTKEHLNWMKISVGGESALKDEISLRAGLQKILTKEKTSNKFFYPPGAVDFLIFIGSTASFALAVGASISKMNAIAIVGWCLFLAFVWYHATGKFFKPFMTFATKRNEKLAEQYRWLSRLVIGLAASALASVALKFYLAS